MIIIFFLIRQFLITNNIQGSTILENDARKPTLDYKFADVVTPIG